MKKTLIATAIAGAMSFSVAAQAAPTVYGNIQLAVDLKNDATAGDNGSTIGFKGEEAMESGLTAIYKMEFHAKAGSNGNNTNEKAATATEDAVAVNTQNGIYGTDQNYLGVKGDFGTVRVGAFDTISNDFVGDMVYGAEFADVRGGASIVGAEAQQVQYTGDFGGLTVGASVNLDGGDQAMQFGVKAAVAEGIVASAALSTEDGMGFGLEAAMGDITIGGKFETSDTVDMNIAASAALNFGAGTAYGVFDMTDTGTADTTDFAFGATYNITNSLYAYGEMSTGDSEEMTAVGAVLSF